jgi:hypothetical protein
MRPLIILFFATSVVAHAQPTFCFTLAEDRQQAVALERPLNVVQHYRERVPYVGMSGTWQKPEETLPLQGAPLFRDSTESWTVHRPREGMAESYVLVIHKQDTMLLDLPEDPKPLIDRAWQRGDRDTPEVIRFRKGRYAIEQLITTPWAVAAANALAARLIAEDDSVYKKQLADQAEHYRNEPQSVPPASPRTPPPPLNEEQWAAYWAALPPLRKADVERVSADTVWVKITGRVMLDGGCASGMPMFGIEMLTDTGWVERIPFDMTQMDCGMPWADWEDHLVMLPPLRWWVGMHQLGGKKELLPGNYRLFFVGGDMKRMWTEPFAVE